MSAPTDGQIRAAAEAKIAKALALIERAQNDLCSACSELSAITHGAQMWNATSKMADKVRATWWRVHHFRMRGKFGLDSMNVAALEKKLATQEAEK